MTDRFRIYTSGVGGSSLIDDQKLSVVRFREIVAGTNITLTTTAGAITINSTGGGGAGNPGGLTTQVQYNNAGVFAGSASITVNSNGTLNALANVIAVSTTTKTLALTDGQTIQDCSNASTQTITIPANASVAFPVNTVIQFEQNGAGGVTVTGASGVTLNGNLAGSASVSTQYSSFYIRKEATNTWFAEGIAAGGGGSGTVTSVTFTGDGTVLSSTPSSAVTTSGTVTAVLANAGAGTILANATGSSAAPTYTATPLLGKAGTTAGTLTFSGVTSGTCIVKTASAAGTSTVFQLPASNGTSGQFLQTDGFGITSWQPASGSGTVTSVVAGTGLTGGTITTTGTIALAANQSKRSVSVVFDGGGSALTSGKVVYLSNIPYSGTITGVTLLADQSGSAVVDVWKVAYASAPPTVSNTITASALPTLSSVQKNQDTTLTGWTTSVTAGDTMAFKLNSVSTITFLSLTLQVTAS